MPTPHQDFDAPSGSATEYSGTLTLGARVWKIRHRDDVPFEIVKRLMGQEDVDPEGDPDAMAKRAREVVMQTGPFFEATIVPEEVDEFMAMFEDSRSPITLGKLRAIMEYVSGVVFSEEGDERPTKPSRAKRPGRSSTGSSSEASSSSEATPRRVSAG